MLKKIIITGCIVFIFQNSFSQADSVSKKINHYFGLQANELIRQVVNLNSNTSAVNNPYLLTYSFNSIKSGWGGALGLGYTYSQTKVEEESSRNSKNNSLFARAGVERKVELTKKWMAGYGLDAVVVFENSNTTSSTVSFFDSTKTEVKSKTTGFGGGFRFTLSYAINSKILLGTEASYYFTASTDKQDIKITTIEFGSGGSFPHTTDSSISIKNTQLKLSLPVAIYLIVRF